ncbi:hypothetical protein [Reyranella sp. CPCC 100927]|uniref:hypothetical protein n=1 Tax=Reyranella sp. CPCC 100927 TaxID=2599616 RepID=UPI0015B78A6D|nr:hypothetical protein [Reyranella sp. CPCC 100927]
MQKRWWLGFVGLLGFLKLPAILAALDGTSAPWGLLDYLALSWFLWFLYFVPETRRT